MAEQRRDVNEFLNFEKMDFQQLLWRQLDRIGQTSHDWYTWITNIRTLKNFLYAYMDDYTKQKIEQISQNYDEQIKKTGNQNVERDLNMSKMSEILNSLICLMDRKGWLAEKEKVGGEPHG